MARTEEVKVVLTADNKTKKGFKEAETGLSSLDSKAKSLAKTLIGPLGLTIGFAGLVAGMKKSIDAFGVQERAVARLEANVKNVLVSFKGFEQGSEETKRETQRLTTALTEQAAALQQLTTFGDEQIISAQAMLSTFALSGQQIQSLTPRVLDMAAAMEKANGTQADLEAITIAVGKALTLGVGSLTRYGVVISDTAREQFEMASEAEKLNIIMQELDKNFAGVAEAVGNTATGQMIKFQHAMGDLQENIGEVLSEALLPFIQKLTVFAQDPSTVEMVRSIAQAFVWLFEGIGMVVKALQPVHDAMVVVGDAVIWVTMKIWDMVDAINALISRAGGIPKAISGAASFLSGSAFTSGVGVAPLNALSRATDLLGFQSGGFVPGPIGAPQLAMVHGGERIIPNGGSGGGAVVNIYNPVLLDDTMIEAVSRKVGASLRQQMRV